MADGKDNAPEVAREFREAVNMTPAALKKWLATEESKEVGYKAEGSEESVGHEMGTHIAKLLGTKQADLSEDDLKAMRKVVGYVRLHLAQKPSGDLADTPWRRSLMNWGHDPLKPAKTKRSRPAKKA